MMLQLVGIYSVIRKLRAKHVEVGAPGGWESISQWWKQWTRRNITIDLTETASII